MKLFYPKLSVKVSCTKIRMDEMVEAFEIMEKHDYDTWIFGPHKDVEEWEKVRAGLKAFAEYFFALWW